MRRVVITGLGAVTPLADGVKPTWDALLASKSGLGHISYFGTDDAPCKIAGELPREGEHAFNADNYLASKEQRKMDNFIIYACAAADQAMADSGYTAETEEQQHRSGIIIGSGIGGLATIESTVLAAEEKGLRRAVGPFFIPSCLINLASGHVSIKYGFKGPNHSVVTACSTGAHAIGDGAAIIARGDADVMVAGGAEAAICRVGIAGFAAARALSTGYNDDPAAGSRPWDKGRDGFVMGEGAGVVVLEEYEHAKARGARIYAEVAGYGLSGDAHHITAPASDGDGGFRAMKMAMERAGMNPEDIDYVNAHGTSTPLGDEIEHGAVKRLFGAASDKMCMSSTKSAIGHLLGAAGSVEAIFSALSVYHNIVPPTLNLDDPSDACDLDLVPHTARDMTVNAALSNSFGFGGTNASLIVKKV